MRARAPGPALAAVVLAAALVCPRLSLAQRLPAPSVTSADPTEARLLPGARGRIVLRGTGLDRLTGAVVLRRGIPIRGVRAVLGAAEGSTLRAVVVTAARDARPGTYDLAVTVTDRLRRTIRVSTPVRVVVRDSRTPRAPAALVDVGPGGYCGSPGMVAPEGPGETDVQVCLDRAAPAGGATVQVTTTHPSIVTVPSSVTVPGRNSVATFRVSWGAVATRTDTYVRAVLDGVERSTLITLRPTDQPVVIGASLNRPNVIGGLGLLLTVELDRPAPPEGAEVIFGFDGSALTVEGGTVQRVPGGQQTHAFQVVTLPVESAVTKTIVVTTGLHSRSVQLTIEPPPGELASFAIDPADVAAGASATATVTFTEAAPIDRVVAIDRDTLNDWAGIPSTVTLPRNRVDASFPLSAPTSVEAPTPVTLTAGHAGVTRSATVTFHPLPVLASLGVSNSRPVAGEEIVAALALEGPAPAGGAEIAFATSSAVIPVPAVVDVPEGRTSVEVPLQVGTPADPISVTLTATLNRSIAALVDVQLGATIDRVEQLPGRAFFGRSPTGRLVLDRPAPSAGVPVEITSDSPLLRIEPSSHTIGPGIDELYFIVHTDSTPGVPMEVATIRLTDGTKTLQHEIRLYHEPALAGLTVTDPDPVLGDTIMLAIEFENPVPKYISTPIVAMSSDQTACLACTRTPVEPGGTFSVYGPDDEETTVTLELTVRADSGLTTATPITYTATMDGVQRSVTFTVHPAP